jgi:hypothetical protein
MKIHTNRTYLFTKSGSYVQPLREVEPGVWLVEKKDTKEQLLVPASGLQLLKVFEFTTMHGATQWIDAPDSDTAEDLADKFQQRLPVVFVSWRQVPEAEVQNTLRLSEEIGAEIAGEEV